MTPGDITDAMMADERITHFRDVSWGERCQFDDIYQMFGLLLEHLRPGPNAEHWRPLSPVETDRLRIALRTIADAIDTAHARKPAHFYIVAKGGR
jgi:hypothetical protein